MDIAVVGTGYAGLVTGACLADFGHQVTCVDIDKEKIWKLNQGEVPFFEPGLTELVKKSVTKGKLSFSVSLAEILPDVGVIYIAVGTPPLPNGKVNMDYVHRVAEEIGRNLDHDALIIDKSTVPVGTAKEVKDIILEEMEKRGLGKRERVAVVSNPEFLREGSAIKDFKYPDRIVIGVEHEWAAKVMQSIYSPIRCEKVVTSLESAELIKYAANAFLATKISFINEVANICEQVGADVRDVAYGIGLDKRIGPAFLQAGIGYGGSCFPKDVSALHQIANTKGYDFKLLKAVIDVNNQQRRIFMDKVRKVIGKPKGKTIGVWGLAFKAGTDDIRESAAIDVVDHFLNLGAEVRVYDPEAMDNARRRFGDSITYTPDKESAADKADALLVMTEWPEFHDLQPVQISERMNEPIIFDARNLLADLNLSTRGFDYYGMGVQNI